jgi:hypothetical protein
MSPPGYRQFGFRTKTIFGAEIFCRLNWIGRYGLLISDLPRLATVAIEPED